MKHLDIRARMLLAALLPVVLVSVLLTGVFVLMRFDDLQETYQQRARSVLRQLALASEYGLFSANQAQLQVLVHGALREPDVRWVAVLDERGQLLAQAGGAEAAASRPLMPLAEQTFDVRRRLDVLVQPVFSSGVGLDDLYQPAAAKPVSKPVQLGQVVVVFSRQSVDLQQQRMGVLGGMISFFGLLFGVALALVLSRGVSRPIARITQLVERIGQGDFAAATAVSTQPVKSNDPLRHLQVNLQHMAARLSASRDDLEQQISSATQALREKKEEAEQATLAKSRFLAAASHDLRQPTHALGMFVARLLQLTHDAPTRALIGQLEASVQAMQNLLDGLLDISRLEAQAVQVKRQPFALSGVLQQVQLALAETAQQKGLQLRIRSCSLWVMSDATLLYRMVLNLVANALRYTNRGGVLVACRLLDGGRQVQIQVWDSGIGIAPEHQQDVFKEFYQLDNSARDRNKGMGLGLSIVQRTAALLGHPLQLSSRLGLGSRFSLTLPVVSTPDEVPAEADRQPALQDALADAVVLVIEDDALVRSALVGLLAGWGMQVHQAQALDDAQGLLAAGLQPAVIVSDYRLPNGQNGIDVVQALRRQLQRAVPACLMSGDTDGELMKVAQLAGLTLLHKPVRPAKLRSLLSHLLRGHPEDEDLR